MCIEFLVTALVVAIIPGTGVIYTLSVGASRGFMASVIAALGCTFGIVPAMTAAVAGLAVLLRGSLIAFDVIKYLGVCYLLYMAWQLWKSGRDSIPAGNEAGASSARRVIMKGFLLNVLNPKLAIFFLALLPQFVRPGEPDGWMYGIYLGAVFMLITFAVFVVYGALASLLHGRSAISGNRWKWLQRSFAASFLVLAVMLGFSSK